MNLTIAEIEDFVRPDYEEKDPMHDLGHIRRILKSARALAENHDCNVSILTLGAYFHGIIKTKENEIRKFLGDKGFSDIETEKIIIAARESQTESEPQTPEGMILHDAHLIEGGRTFIITKSLVTGAARGQTLEETLEYIERFVLGKFKCFLPEARAVYEQKEFFAREFIKDLKENL